MQRVFHDVSSETTAAINRYATEFLREVGERPRIWQRFSSHPENRLVRLLRALRAGVEAESRSMIQRADFYLEAAHFEFDSLNRSARLWETINAKAGGTDLRRAIASELFLENHIGFIKGYVPYGAAQSSDRRIRRHIEWAERILPFTELDPAGQSAVRAWLHSHQIAAFERTDDHAAALSVYERALDAASPAAFKEAFIERLYTYATGQSGAGASDGDAKAGKATLASAIERFTRSFDRVSDRPTAFQRLAELNRLSVAALADAEDPGPRFAAFQRTVDADPFDLETQRSDVQWRFAVADSQEKLARAEAEAGAEGKVLNAKGLQLKAMFARAFSEAQAYLASNEAKAVQTSAQARIAERLWRSLNLPEQPGWQARSLDLADAVGAALTTHDPDNPDFVDALRTAVDSRPSLAGLDLSAAAMRLIVLRGKTEGTESAAAPAVPEFVQAVDALRPEQQTAALTAEDLSDWFFSHHASRARWATAAALVLLTAAAGLTAYNSRVAAYRDSLYPQIMAAARENRNDLVIDLAPKFLAARPLSGRGTPDEAVGHAWAESLVTLTAQSAGRPSASLLEAARRYSQLVSEPKGGRQ